MSPANASAAASSAPATPPGAPLPLEAPAGRLRTVVTPEGVPLAFEVAQAGDRLGAFLLDVLFIVLLTLLAASPAIVLGLSGAVKGDLVLAVTTVAVFLVRTFYFAFFELSWQGQTPGKRKLGLRAIEARGGPLAAEAIIARNLTREVELFLPLVALLAPAALFPEAPGWTRLGAVGWMVIFGLLPFFNRDRLRVGDLIGGTVVVRTPEARLLGDLASVAPAASVAFSEAQLDVYGVYELQVLESVLRDRGKAGNADALRTVADKVKAKLGWEGPAPDDAAFLDAFYLALRGRLERRLLFGRRRAHKHDRG